MPKGRRAFAGPKHEQPADYQGQRATGKEAIDNEVIVEIGTRTSTDVQEAEQPNPAKQGADRMRTRAQVHGEPTEYQACYHYTCARRDVPEITRSRHVSPKGRALVGLGLRS